MRRHWQTLALTVAAMMLLGGCSSVPGGQPVAKVTAVHLAQQSVSGARVEFTVQVNNPSDTDLPVTAAKYRVRVAGQPTFKMTAMPPVALPPNGTQTIHLAAAVPTHGQSLAGKPVEVSGGILYTPPGAIRKLLTQYHVPLPQARFAAKGTLKK